MGLAEDKVYAHITGNLKKFAAIRVASLADSLTCLVDSDRDELLAREETRGNQAAVFRFYQHLRCRKGWVQDLIQALHQNNAGHLADELQEVYDTWQPRPRSSAPTADSSLPSDARPATSSISAQTPSRGSNPAPGAPLAEQPQPNLPVGDHPPVLPSAATPTSMDLGARLPVQESLPKKLPEQESPRPIAPETKVHDRVSSGHSGEGNRAGAVPVPGGTPGRAVPSAVSMPVSGGIPGMAAPSAVSMPMPAGTPGRAVPSTVSMPVPAGTPGGAVPSAVSMPVPAGTPGRAVPSTVSMPVPAGTPGGAVPSAVSMPVPAGTPGMAVPSAVSMPVPAGTPGVAVPSAVSPEQGRDWLSRRPVCVDNGFFGNANHLHRGTPGLALGGSVPSRDAGATHSPEQPRNEPEENSDVSTASSPRLEGATRVGQQAPNSLPKKQPVPSSGHGEPTSSFVDVRSPLLIQQQFDAEKKQAGMLREHRGSADASKTSLVATPVPRDTSLSLGTSVKSPTEEKKLPIGNRASSIPSVPTKEKVLPALANPVLGTAVVGGSEGMAGRSASRVSSATSIWASHGDEEKDEEFSKPGVLVSVPQSSPEVAGRCPSSQKPSKPHSEASSSLGLSSDPILVSTDSLSSGGAFPRVSSVCADPRGKEASGASRDSSPAPSWDSTTLGTHQVHVDHHPSPQLGASSDGVGALGSPLNFNSGSGCDAATSSPQAEVLCGDSSGLSLLYILPAVGIISAMAFAVYARLRK